MSADYRVKYIDIRNKLVKVTDVAYRQGYEEGLKEGQMQAQMQAQQQQMEMQQQAMMQQQMPPGAEGDPQAQGMEGAPEEGMPPEMGGEEAPMMGEMPEEQGSELDANIAELESLVSKGEKPKVTDIRKVVENIVTIRKSFRDTVKKQQENSSAQRKVVEGILKSWDKEVESEYKNLDEILKEHEVSE